MKDENVKSHHHLLPKNGRAGFGRRMRVLLFRNGDAAFSADRFREQMQLLDRWGYTPVTFNDYRLISDGELAPPRKPIILTFDDGDHQTIRTAVPILQEFGMRAVLFVAGEPDTGGGPGDKRPGGPPPSCRMSEQEILELHEMGFEIGSASLTHAGLPFLPKEKAWEEISRSRMRLEITLNAQVRAFAYPSGLLNPTLKEMVAAAGYQFGCAIGSGPVKFAEDPFEIRRMAISPLAGSAEFALNVLGPHPGYRWRRGTARPAAPAHLPPIHPSQSRTLFLVSAGLQWPGREEFARREAEDRTPRLLPLFDSLNADILDERFLESAPQWRAFFYRLTGVDIAQILEAFRLRKSYDVILSWAEHLGLPLAGLLRLTGSRAIQVSIFSWISKPKKARILRAVHPSIDRIILMSSAQREFAVNTLRIPAAKIALLRWPVDEKFWRPMGGPQEIISAVGREMRDFKTLIEAVRDTGIPCHIAAGGQLETQKEDLWIKDINGVATLPPTVTIGGMGFADLRSLYDRSRFVVIPLFPTDTDNGTTSILEAMAMGKAVICSRVDGQRDVIREGHTGLFVPPGDPRALREAIEHLWSHPAIAAYMGKNGRAHVERYHTLDAWIGDVRHVIEDAMAGAGASRVTGRDRIRAGINGASTGREHKWIQQPL